MLRMHGGMQGPAYTASRSSCQVALVVAAILIMVGTLGFLLPLEPQGGGLAGTEESRGMSHPHAFPDVTSNVVSRLKVCGKNAVLPRIWRIMTAWRPTLGCRFRILLLTYA
jgi:hypothetical protein